MRRNNVTLTGRIATDVEVKELSGGHKILRVAVPEDIKSNRDGETQTRTIWHNIVWWNKSADHYGKYLKKGDKITVLRGNLDYETRTKDGVEYLAAYIANSDVDFSGNPKKVDGAGPNS